MSERIPIDAEAVELRLPENRKIQVKTPRMLERIAGRVGKPIIREQVNGGPSNQGSGSANKASYLLAVYDGPWVYYCECEEDPSAKEEANEP